jgi:hypothetical protein
LQQAVELTTKLRHAKIRYFTIKIYFTFEIAVRVKELGAMGARPGGSPVQQQMILQPFLK